MPVVSQLTISVSWLPAQPGKGWEEEFSSIALEAAIEVSVGVDSVEDV